MAEATFRCPECGGPTVYQLMSGGRNYWCETCETVGEYPEQAEGLPRATLLREPGGAEKLREMMREEIERRRAASDG